MYLKNGIQDIIRIYLISSLFLLPLTLLANNFNLMLTFSCLILTLVILITNDFIYPKIKSPFIPIFVFTTIVWIHFRSMTLTFFPEKYNYQYILGKNPELLTRSFFLTSISILIVVLGFYLGHNIEKRLTKIINTKSTKKKNFSVILKISYVLFIISICGDISLHYARLNNFFPKEIATILLPTYKVFFLIVSMSTVLTSNFENKTKQKYFFFLFLFFLLDGVLISSKGAIFFFIYFSLITYISMNKYQIPIRLKAKHIYSLILILLSAVFFYQYSMNSRALDEGIYLDCTDGILNNEFTLNKLGLHDLMGTKCEDVNIPMLTTIDTLKKSVRLETYSHILESVSRRLSVIDYLNLYFNKDPTLNNINISAQMKSIMNTIVPGTYYPNQKLFAARKMKVAYEVIPYSEILKSYHSDMIPLFGNLWLEFKYSSFIIIFLIGIILKLIERYFLKTKIIFHAIFYYIIVDFFWGMGLDSTFQEIYMYILPSFILMILLTKIHLKFQN